jgi:hypothetical protein
MKSGDKTERRSARPEIELQLGHAESPNEAAISPEWRRVLTNSNDSVILWDITTFRKLTMLEGKSDHAVVFSSDETRIIGADHAVLRGGTQRRGTIDPVCDATGIAGQGLSATAAEERFGHARGRPIISIVFRIPINRPNSRNDLAGVIQKTCPGGFLKRQGKWSSAYPGRRRARRPFLRRPARKARRRPSLTDWPY